MNGRKTVRLILATILLAVTAGCSVLGGSAEAAKNTGPVEKPKIKVGVLPIIDDSPVFIAIEKGYFREAGLEVEPVTIQGGAAAVPGLTGGSLDFSFGNWVSFFLAQSKGIDLKLIADGYQAAPNMFMLMRTANSPIKTAKDLVGKTIAINTKDNIAELTTRAVLAANDVDLKKVKFQEIPFPDMEAALIRNQIDAAFMVEPFITKAKMAAGAEAVVDTASGPTADIPIAGYAATAKFVKENPKTVAAFRGALMKAQQDAKERTNVEAVLPKFAKIDTTAAHLVQLGVFPTSLDSVRLQRVVDLMMTYGLLKNPMDAGKMILN